MWGAGKYPMGRKTLRENRLDISCSLTEGFAGTVASGFSNPKSALRSWFPQNSSKRLTLRTHQRPPLSTSAEQCASTMSLEAMEPSTTLMPFPLKAFPKTRLSEKLPKKLSFNGAINQLHLTANPSKQML